MPEPFTGEQPEKNPPLTPEQLDEKAAMISQQLAAADGLVRSIELESLEEINPELFKFVKARLDKIPDLPEEGIPRLGQSIAPEEVDGPGDSNTQTFIFKLNSVQAFHEAIATVSKFQGMAVSAAALRELVDDQSTANIALVKRAYKYGQGIREKIAGLQQELATLDRHIEAAADKNAYAELKRHLDFVTQVL